MLDKSFDFTMCIINISFQVILFVSVYYWSADSIHKKLRASLPGWSGVFSSIKWLQNILLYLCIILFHFYFFSF